MGKIYEQAKDVYVAANVVYVNPAEASGTSYAYADAEFKVKVSKDELVDMFVKGMVIDAGEGELHRPVSCAKTEEYTSVATADAVTLYSAEYTA